MTFIRKESLLGYKEEMENLGKIVGSTMESKELKSNMDFIHNSKEKAKKYEWLYQCTSMDALKSILKSHEIWLTNLQKVNDKEEAERITVPEFEKSYFVACFTYADNIPEEHWNEYGNGANSVLYGFKPQWVLKDADFMWTPGEKIKDKNFKIYQNYDKALEVTLNKMKMNRIAYNPYYFFDFGFYQIIYDDDLKKNMDGDCSWNVGDETSPEGRFITPGMPGIIKNTHGLCKRSNAEAYDKDWTSEKEVRLKAGIMSNYTFLREEIMIPYLAVKLSEQAFDSLIIRFSPLMSEDKQKESLEELKEIVPDACIHILK